MSKNKRKTPSWYEKEDIELNSNCSFLGRDGDLPLVVNKTGDYDFFNSEEYQEEQRRYNPNYDPRYQ